MAHYTNMFMICREPETIAEAENEDSDENAEDNSLKLLKKLNKQDAKSSKQNVQKGQ